jgi:hypothetical protein
MPIVSKQVKSEIPLKDLNFAQQSFKAKLSDNSNNLFHGTDIEALSSILESKQLQSAGERSKVRGKSLKSQGINPSYGNFIYTSPQNPLETGDYFYGIRDPHAYIELDRNKIDENHKVFSSPYEDNVHLVHGKFISTDKIKMIHISKSALYPEQIKKIINITQKTNIPVQYHD